MLEQMLPQSRRTFLSRTGTLTTACAVAGFAGGAVREASASAGDGAGETNTKTLADRHYVLTGVRLEEGFERDGDIVVATRTALYALEIKDGAIVANYPDRSEVLERVEPVYETLPGWRTTLSDTREPGALPDAARAFLALVEAQVGVPVKVVGVGAERDDYLLWSA